MRNTMMNGGFMGNTKPLNQNGFNSNTQQYDMSGIMASERNESGFGNSSRIGTSVTNNNPNNVNFNIVN